MTWIELHTNLPRHPKTMQLQERLRMKAPTVIGHLCLLWMWALENAPDGRLDRMDAKALARICQIPAKRAGEFQQALLDCAFLDRDEQGLRIHDWETYAGRYDAVRRRNAERQKEYRQRVKEKRARDDNVTGLQDRTVQDRTEPDRTGEDRTDLSSGGGDEGARADERTALQAYLTDRNLEPRDYFGAEPELLDRCAVQTDELFRRFAARPPTDLDRALVFFCLTRQGPEGTRRLDDDARDLLFYAFEQAAMAGKGGVWPYIEGVLGRLHRRQLDSLRKVEGYELKRMGL